MQSLLRNLLFSLFLLLSGALLPAAAVAGAVYGDVTLGMAEYVSRENGVEVERISSLQQQYTLGVAKRGIIGDTRFGNYSLMLGYEFNVVNPERSVRGVRDPEVSRISTDKIYYNANMLMAPGGLPFRLTLFANDLHRTVFIGGQVNSLSTGVQGETSRITGHLVDTNIATDVLNGSHQIIGGTLYLGIRNGSYLGAYRDVLSQLPRLLIDYKQEDVKNLKSHFAPEHFRNRDLAFISLNKKDNWVHLRMRDFTDFLDSHNNTKSAQVMIGTIDHTLSRQWINLTNWIKISGDLAYSVDKQTFLPDPVASYNLHLLAVTQRERVRGAVLSSFSRTNDGQSLAYTADLPVSMSLEVDRDTVLSSRFIYAAMQKNAVDGIAVGMDSAGNSTMGFEFSNRDYYLDLSAALRRTRPVVFRPRFEMEARDEGDNRHGLALRLGGEMLKNSLLNTGPDWAAGYALTATQGENNDATTSFWQQDLSGRIAKNLTPMLRVGGDGKLTVSSGVRPLISFRIPTMSGDGLGTAKAAVMVFNSDLNLFLDHHFRQLGNRFDLHLDTQSGYGVTTWNSEVTHSLGYYQISHAFDWRTRLNIGDSNEQTAVTSTDFVVGSNNAAASNNLSWRTTANYTYTPSRSSKFNLKGDISGGDAITYTVGEEFAYRFFTTNGIIRTIAEFSEEIANEKVSQAMDGRDSTIYGRFSAAYYPTKYLFTRLRSELVSFVGSTSYQQTHTGEVGLNFEKLRVLASYSEGRKDKESAALPSVLERRWEVKVKKIF